MFTVRQSLNLITDYCKSDLISLKMIRISQQQPQKKPKTHVHIRASVRTSRLALLSALLSWLTADKVTSQTKALSRVIGNNNLGIQTLRRRAGNVISGGVAQFCTTLCFLSCLYSASSALRCYLRRPDGEKILFCFVFFFFFLEFER